MIYLSFTILEAGNLYKEKRSRGRKMEQPRRAKTTQCLKAMAILAEDMSLVSSIHMAAHNSCSRQAKH